MKEKNIKWTVTITAILILLILIWYSFIVDIKAFITDHVIFIFLIIFFHKTYEHWRLTPFIYSFMALALLLHSYGSFGWYGTSPLFIPWERITHFIGIMPFTLLFFSYLIPHFDNKFNTQKNWTLLIMIFLTVIGLGAIVEMSEFLGFLTFGNGDGFLMFGDGDGILGKAGVELLDAYGAGWFNASWDMITNSMGVLTMLILASISHWRKRVK